MEIKQQQLGKKKLALGKGIASLLETNAIQEQKHNPEQGEGGTPLMVHIESIQLNPYQPRKIFREKPLRELADSIREAGLIQPLVVSQTPGQKTKFELISGERRLRASKIAGLQQVPILVRRVTDREKLVVAIVENVQRSELNCVEEALAYYQLMDEFKLSQEEVAKKIGKERSSVANFLRILKLPRPVVELLQREQLSFGHGKVLAAIKDPEQCTRIAEQAYKKGLSVRQIEELLKRSGDRPKKELLPLEPGEENLESLRQALEKKTGHHFAFKTKSNGSGQIIINYSDKSEFNEIFEYLIR